MKNRHKTFPFQFSIVLSLIVVAAITAAPILPQGQNLPDEVHCLAGIQTVSVDVDQVVGRVMDEKSLKVQFRKALKASGFLATQEAGTPHLVLQYIVATNQDVPGAVSLTTIISVHQRVDLHRMGKTMTLPVASIIQAALGTEEHLQELLAHEIQRATDRLARYVAWASRTKRS
jgi:hypothetical protein